MPITNFKDKIDDFVGNNIVVELGDDAAIEQAIVDGCYDIYRRIAKTMPIEIELFTTGTNITNDNGFDLDEQMEVASIRRRNGSGGVFIECRMIDAGQGLQFAGDSNSIHLAINLDPVFYVHNNRVFVKPAPSSDDQVDIRLLPAWAVTSWDTGTSTIPSFPKKYYEHICLYAAIRVLYYEMSKYASELPIDIALPALDFGNATGTGFWLTEEEDAEMVQSAVSIIQSQVSGAQLELANADKQTAKIVSKYNWAKERLQFLNSQYELLFSAGTPAPPPGAGPPGGGR